jgi:hypothetical protein
VIEPAHLWIPDRVGSYGDEAIDLAADAGKTLDDEQKLAVDALLSYGPGGRWAALESAIIEARQQGKTTNVLEPVTMFDLWLLPPDRIVWTAHLFRTARDAFDDFCVCIETSSALSRRVKKISYSHGEEFIELHTGAKLEFLARSSGGGRGLGGKRVVMDEALILAASSMGALMPTLSARDDPQINYGSSGAKETSDHLHGLIKRGRKGGDPSLILVEFCAPGSWDDPGCEQGRTCPHTVGTDGCALDDESLWPRANHAIGRPGRTTFEYVRAERRALPPREFGRERYGWHEAPLGESGVIDLAAWLAAVDPESKRHGDVTVGVDISPQQDFAAIGIFGLREDGREHLQLSDYRPGTDWIVPRMVELRAALDPAGWAMGRNTFAVLEAELGKNDFTIPEDRAEPQRGNVARMLSTEMAAACGQMLHACRPVKGDSGESDYRFRHLGQRELDQAVQSGRIREGADTVTWSRKDSGSDICPLGAVTNARWVFQAWAHLIANDYDLMDSVL